MGKSSNRVRIFCLICVLILSSCQSSGADKTDGSAADAGDSLASDADTAASLEAALNTDTADLFTKRDYQTAYDTGSCAEIFLEEDTASCGSNAVQIDGSNVIISDEGTYVLSGELTDGSIIVDADKKDKVQLVLKNASVTSSHSAALYIRQADKVFVTLADSSENILKNGGSFETDGDDNIDAAIFSKDDLTLNGNGSLTVESPAGHGVVSKDDLVITGGTYTISAAGQGLSGKDSVRIAGGTFAVSAGTDGIRSKKEDADEKGFVFLQGGVFDISAADDGIHSNGSITVNGGDFTVAAGDDGFHADEALTISAGTVTVSESYEGLEGLHITVAGGTIALTASDDGINAAGGSDRSGFGGKDDRFGGGWENVSDGSLLISGGFVQIHASGDAIDANGTMEMTGGTVLTSGPDHGDTSILDYDRTGTISGGTFVGVGSSMMAENFSGAETQGAIMTTVSSRPAGTTITLSDQEGTVLVEQQADQEFSCVILSCAGILQGRTYTLTIGSDTQTITMDELVVSITDGPKGQGSFGRRGGPGGPRW